jgi:hypothetical protein
MIISSIVYFDFTNISFLVLLICITINSIIVDIYAILHVYYVFKKYKLKLYDTKN